MNERNQPSTRLPLLVEGFNLTGAAATVAGGAVARLNGAISQGRGRLRMIDVISTKPRASNASGCLFSLSMGGQQIIQNAGMNEYAAEAQPGCYMPTLVDIGPGQDFNAVLDNTLGAVTQGGALIFGYENPYDTPEHWRKFRNRKLALKNRSFLFTINAGLITAQTPFPVPSQNGKVIGVAVFGESATQTINLLGFCTLAVNGVNIFKTFPIALGDAQTSRPYEIFPVEIEEGSTLDLTIDNSLNAATLRMTLRLYFEGPTD